MAFTPNFVGRMPGCEWHKPLSGQCFDSRFFVHDPSSSTIFCHMRPPPHLQKAIPKTPCMLHAQCGLCSHSAKKGCPLCLHDGPSVRRSSAPASANILATRPPVSFNSSGRPTSATSPAREREREVAATGG